MMLFLSRLDPLILEPPFFMLEGREVVYSPAESRQNVLAHESDTSRKLLFKTAKIGPFGLAN
jgi:hypothetical protein